MLPCAQGEHPLPCHTSYHSIDREISMDLGLGWEGRCQAHMVREEEKCLF